MIPPFLPKDKSTAVETAKPPVGGFAAEEEKKEKRGGKFVFSCQYNNLSQGGWLLIGLQQNHTMGYETAVNQDFNPPRQVLPAVR